MSEAGLRQLDRDLPRISVYSPAFLARRRAFRSEPAAVVSFHEFVARQKPTTDQIRAKRRELAERAQQIHAETSGMSVIHSDKDLTDAEIIKAVADEFGVTVSDIRGECRAVFIVAVRHRAIVRVYLAKPHRSLPQIGRSFGRDHTTIIHAVQRAGVWQPRSHGPYYQAGKGHSS